MQDMDGDVKHLEDCTGDKGMDESGEDFEFL